MLQYPNMKVSVVVPCFNEEKYIGACLKALQKQTASPDEIIVVDNNSTDKTASIARSMGAKVIVVKEQGITPARNAGFDAAKYQIIARCDADTKPFPDWISRIKKSFNDKAVLGITGTNEFYDAPPELKSTFEKIFSVAYFGGNRKMLGHEAFYGSNMAFRKSTWELVKSEICNDDKLVHEDIDLAIHVSEHGKIVFDPELMVACSMRALKVDLPTMVERMSKWPRSKIVHTRLKKFAKPGRRHSSTAQNSRD